MNRDQLTQDWLQALDPVETFRQAFDLQPLEWQIRYLREERNVILKKGRQIGATQSCAALAIHTAMYQRDALVCVISPSLKQSSEITTRARQGLEHLGEPLAQDSASLIRLRSGGRIMSLPGSPRSARGWSAQLLILDEASFLVPETITAAQALTATGGRQVWQSTPAASTGQFHDMWAYTPPSWARMAVRSDECPTLIPPDWLEDQRMSMSDTDFRAEFLGEFADEGTGGWFSPARLAAMTVEVEVGMLDRIKGGR